MATATIASPWPAGGDVGNLFQSAALTTDIDDTAQNEWDALTLPYDCKIVRMEACARTFSTASSATATVTVTDGAASPTALGSGVFSAAITAGAVAGSSIIALATSVSSATLAKGTFLCFAVTKSHATNAEINGLVVRVWVIPVYK